MKEEKEREKNRERGREIDEEREKGVVREKSLDRLIFFLKWS